MPKVRASMPRKKTGRPSRKDIDYPKLAKEWLRSSPVLTLTDFAKQHNVPERTLRQKQLIINGKKTLPFRTKERAAFQSTGLVSSHKIRSKLESVELQPGKHYIRALEQGRALLEHLMVRSAEGFEEMASTPLAYNSAGEAARVSMAAAKELRELCLELQGVPGADEDYGWPVTRGFWPHPYQRDFIFDTPETMRQHGGEMFLQAFIGGVGSGKTRCGAEKFGNLAWLNRGTQGGVFAPTYRMLEDSTKRVFFEVLGQKGLSYRYRASDNSVILFGDTRIIFRSMEKYEHIRGMELGYFWIDEPGQMSDGSAFNVIMGRVRDSKAPQACGLITSTPDGLNWLYDELVTRGRDNKVKLYAATTQQNVSLPKAYVKRLEALYDERYAKQELGGVFLDVFSGQAYWNFERAHSINNEIGYEPNLPLKLCFDLNVDPMCWGIVQTRRHRDGYDIDFVIDELHVRTASTEAVCAEFIERYRGHRAGVLVYGDSTCRSRATSATRTDYEIIKTALEREFLGVEMNIGKSNPAVTDSVAEVNARLKSGTGERMLFVNGDKCPETVKDFERVAFQPGTRLLDKKDRERTHHTDAIRYYISREYPIRTVKTRLAA